MRVHHVNCATMCPPARRLVNGDGSLFERGRMVAHCLIVEAPEGLVLVDTGFGTGDIANPKQLGPVRPFLKPRLALEETALSRVKALGFEARDVRDICVTHLDLDHAGGIMDFPEARVHIFRPEHAAASARATFMERERYLPAHWAHNPLWQIHDIGGDTWRGLEAIRPLASAHDEIALVPLVGHTRGHVAVAVKGDNGWLVHAGDAYFHRDEIHADPPSCPGGLAMFQRLAAVDDDARRGNQQRLRELRASAPDVRIFSAHDPVELDRLAARA